MRRRFIWRDGRFVEVFRQKPRPRIHVISDSHTPFRSMADGRVYDSKSAYRADLKARGMVELGNDEITPTDRYEPGDIAQDVADVMNGNVPIERGVEAPEGFDMGALE